MTEKWAAFYICREFLRNDYFPSRAAKQCRNFGECLGQQRLGGATLRGPPLRLQQDSAAGEEQFGHIAGGRGRIAYTDHRCGWWIF